MLTDRYDTTAVPGTNLWSTIDLELQEYGEKLMREQDRINCCH